MPRHTLSHWGLYRVEGEGAGLRLLADPADPDPSPIGFHQSGAAVDRLRIRRPAIRQGWLERGPTAQAESRGEEPFVEVGWDVALRHVAAELQRVRAAHGNQAIFGGSYGWASAGRFHHAQSQVHRFLNTIGGYIRHVDSYSLGAGRVLMPHLVATMDELTANHTSWDVLAAHTQLFIAFGGLPAKNAQTSSGGVSDHRLRQALRDMAGNGTRFVNVSPVRDNLETGGPVEWLPIRPNTDTALLLAMAYVLDTEGLADSGFLASHCVGHAEIRPYLLGQADGQPKDPRWAAAITGIPAERIATLAREAAAHRTMLNAAYALQRAVHGEQPFWALLTVAAMLGQIGLPGGGFGVGYGASNRIGSRHGNLRGLTLPQGRNPVAGFIPVARIADMLLHPGAPFTYNGGTHAYPDIRLVYWAGGNPFHHHQDLNRMRRAWRKPETVIVHEPWWTPVARHADIVLPATTTLERDDIGYATREGVVVAMRQAAAPFGEARDDHAIFAALARQMGVEHAFTEGRDTAAWLRHLYDGATAGKAFPAFDAFWEEGVLRLPEDPRPVILLEDFRRDPARHPLATPSGRIELFSARIASFGLADCPGHAAWLPPPEWLGAASAATYPLHLVSDQPERRLHSQLDHSLHSVAGKIGGREVVWMNPADAAARGIGAGDTVVLFNARGRCCAAAMPSADIAPGVARLSTGAWFDPAGDGQTDKHGNPNVLTLDRGASGLSQGCAAHTCLVEIAPCPDAPEVTAHRLPNFYPQGIPAA